VVRQAESRSGRAGRTGREDRPLAVYLREKEVSYGVRSLKESNHGAEMVDLRPLLVRAIDALGLESAIPS
jgi:hypothetical protein